MKLRITPELRFHLDTSVDQGMRIYEALQERPAEHDGRRVIPMD